MRVDAYSGLIFVTADPEVESLWELGETRDEKLRLRFVEEATSPTRSELLTAVVEAPFLNDRSRVEAIYLATLEALHADPSDIVFLDDRPANVEAARKIGMHAEVFTDPAQIDRVEHTNDDC